MIYIRIAGIINLITAFIHAILGQMDLVNPLLSSNLEVQQRAEWLGVWNMVTILLFATSYIILRTGFGKVPKTEFLFLKPIAVLYLLTGIPFIASSIYFSVLAPQWILLMPIGVFLILGLGKVRLEEI